MAVASHRAYDVDVKAGREGPMSRLFRMAPVTKRQLRLGNYYVAITWLLAAAITSLVLYPIDVVNHWIIVLTRISQIDLRSW